MRFQKDGCGRRKGVNSMKKLLFYIGCMLVFYSCAAQQPLGSNAALQTFINDTAFRGAHIGVSIYDPVAKKYVYQHQPDKYFVPASNVKIMTCYAAMKYLKHILPGIHYFENDTAVYLVPTGDPTLLHRDFRSQPVIDFIRQQYKNIYITNKNWMDKELGVGWSWDDYSDEYMTERNALPVYGNTIRWVQEKIRSNSFSLEESFSVYSDPEVNWKVGFATDSLEKKFKVKRDRHANIFMITQGVEQRKEVYVPFITNGVNSALELLKDTTGKTIGIANNFLLSDPKRRTVWSQPTDSVLKLMMYRSDNFLAEQLLLMVSEQRFGVMDSKLIIDSIIAQDMPRWTQTPVWVDGSGLSRYNLFTPAAFVSILDSMRISFGMERLKEIFPTGDSGTLKHYYVSDNGNIYAKTGSMSGVMALSGYLYAPNNRLLIFSVMINNYNGKAVVARRAIERFLKRILR